MLYYEIKSDITVISVVGGFRRLSMVGLNLYVIERGPVI